MLTFLINTFYTVIYYFKPISLLGHLQLNWALYTKVIFINSDVLN